MPTMSSVTLTVAVDAGPDRVYGFVTDPRQLPRWAAGVARSVRREGDDWVVGTPMGDAVIRFAEANPYGVMDHEVAIGDAVVPVPMRVVPNGSGSEVLFTLFRLDGMSDEDFAADTEAVRRDLAALKDVLESEQRLPD